mgnify:CR=1 FL=1
MLPLRRLSPPNICSLAVFIKTVPQWRNFFGLGVIFEHHSKNIRVYIDAANVTDSNDPIVVIKIVGAIESVLTP